MQAVILAAGKSSRFYPYNQTFEHKSLIPLMGKTILEHTITSLKKSQITNIIIVVEKESTIPNLLGDGKHLGVSISYCFHEGAKGMGAALLEAKDLLHENFFLLNAYHADFEDFAQEMIDKNQEGTAVLLGRKETGSPAFGYFSIDKNYVTGIIEKPKSITSEMLRIIGIYLLPPVFLNTLSTTPLSHYHFEEALNTCAKENKVSYVSTDKPSLTLKYVTDLFTFKDYLLGKIKGQNISSKAKVSEDVVITGNVIIEDDVTIMEGVCIKGPTYIGKGTTIGNRAIIRNGVITEENCVIGSQLELKNSIVMDGTTTHSGFIGDSLIGRNTKIAAGVVTANARLDRQSVKLEIKGEKVDTGIRHLGAIIGSDCNLGIRISTMPGVIVGNNVIVGPSTTIMKNIPENTKYYTKFEEVIEEIKDEK